MRLHVHSFGRRNQDLHALAWSTGGGRAWHAACMTDIYLE